MVTQVGNLDITGYGNFSDLVRDLENATDKKTAQTAINKLTQGSWLHLQLGPIESARHYANTPSELPEVNHDANRVNQLVDKAERLIKEKSSEFNINSGFSKTQIALCSALGLTAIGAGIVYSGVVDTNTLASSARQTFSTAGQTFSAAVSNLFRGNSSNAAQAGYGYAGNAAQAGYGYAGNAAQAGYGYAARAINFASQVFNDGNLKTAGTAVGASILGLVGLKWFR